MSPQDTRPRPYARSCRPRFLFALAFLLFLLFSFLTLFAYPAPWISSFIPPPFASHSACPPIHDPQLPSQNDLPSKSHRFRDNLLPHHRYITSFLTGGWTNDVMSYVHLIQLALLTRRSPILGPFSPTHIGYHSGLIPFSHVFDIDYLSNAINLPILEWHDVKNVTNPDPVKQASPEFHDFYGGVQEELGCWSVWMTQRGNGEPARGGLLPDALGLDVSWTPVPFSPKIDPEAGDIYLNVHSLAELGSRKHREKAIARSKTDYLPEMHRLLREKGLSPAILPSTIPVPNSVGSQVDPDDQVLCFDYLYFVASYKLGEWDDEYAPSWNEVGVHLRWSTRIKDLADAYIRRAFKLDAAAPLPVLVTVHIRRADFLGWCGAVSKEECLAPLSAYVKRVQEVTDELVMEGIEPSDVKVVLTTDEPLSSPPDRPKGESEAWWGEVRKLGWTTIDHLKERTVSTHGAWYPALIDACIQSMGNAFVGTDRSTMSNMAALRVRDWANGPTRKVKWGHRHADEE